MTGELIQAGNGIRIIESEIGPVIPALDIAKNIGYTRSAITKAMERGKKKDKALFNGLTAYPRIETKHGIQPVLCLTPVGIDRLISILDPPSKSKAELCERIAAFRKSALSKSTDKSIHETIPAAPDLIIMSLNRNADIAEILINRYDYDPVVAHNLAMTNVVNEVGDIALPWKGPAALPAPDLFPVAEHRRWPEPALPPEADPDFDRYFSLRKIAEIVKESEDRVRNILEKEGLLSYSNTIWHLTRVGEQFGKVFTTYPLWPHRMTEKKNIRWSPAAIERVRIHLSAGQTQLASASVRG